VLNRNVMNAAIPAHRNTRKADLLAEHNRQTDSH